MLEISQNYLIDELIKHKLSLNIISKKPLPLLEEDYIDIVKIFKKEKYYSYQKDGKRELVLANNGNIIYKPLIEFKILDIKFSKDKKFIINIDYDKKNNKIQMLNLLVGGQRIQLQKEQNEFIFVEGEFENILLNELFKIEITFESLIDNNVYNYCEYIKYDVFPKIKSDDYIYKETNQGNVQIFNTKFDEENVAKIEEKFSEFNNNKILLGAVKDEKYLQNLEKNLYTKKLELKDIQYVFVSNNKSFIQNKPEEYFIKRLTSKNTLKKFNKVILKNLYATLGYSNYEMVREKYRKLKSFKNPYLYYCNNINNFKIDNQSVFVYSNNGNDLSGSMFAIVKELEKYDKKIYVGTNDIEVLKAKKEKYNLKINIVEQKSKDFYYYLATSKYLLNDATFPVHYIKNKGQVYINTWHGVPLKNMGRKIKYSKLELANTQRNFMQADKVVLRNDYSINIFSDDYMVPLEKFKLLGAPEIDLLLDEENIKSKTKGIKKVVWMPTWRGVWGDESSQDLNLEILSKVDRITKKFKDKIEIYYKPHPHIYRLVKGKEQEFENINFVGQDEEIYTFLASADALISDYSSIIFDYAKLNKPIILDIFDQENYLESRGTYFSIDDLPFFKSKTEDQLNNILSSLFEEEVNYDEFNNKFNPLEKGVSSQELVEYMFCLGKDKNLVNKVDVSKKVSDIKITKKKEKVLIYPGAMTTNGITTSFLNLLNNIKDFEKEIYIFLPTNIVKNNKDNIDKISDDYKYIASSGNLVMTSYESRIYRKYINRLELTLDEDKVISNIFIRESRRIFLDQKFDYVIHFPGYEAYIAELFKVMDTKKIIYIHNDMEKEYIMKQNFNYKSIKGFCDVANLIRPVNDELSKIIRASDLISPKQQQKVITAHNLVDKKGVLEKSNMLEDYMTEDLENLLKDKSVTKFVNIARFSPEKGIPRLIDAFYEIQKANPKKKMKLILIGVDGADSQKVKKKILKDVLLFQNINPFPILKECDLFVLSSFHEGLPMVFFESIILNVPILSTDIPGPKEFLTQGYGNICDNSKEGIIKGMQRFIDGDLKLEAKSLDEFNQKAKKEFFENFKV